MFSTKKQSSHPTAMLSHIRKHFRKSGFLLLGTGSIHLIFLQVVSASLGKCHPWLPLPLYCRPVQRNLCLFCEDWRDTQQEYHVLAHMHHTHNHMANDPYSHVENASSLQAQEHFVCLDHPNLLLRGHPDPPDQVDLFPRPLPCLCSVGSFGGVVGAYPLPASASSKTFSFPPSFNSSGLFPSSRLISTGKPLTLSGHNIDLPQHVLQKLNKNFLFKIFDKKLVQPVPRYALHSHLVGCHTTFNGDMHVDYSTIYIPCGHGHPWAGPSEWGPLMVFLAAALLWPDLPFLVCHPRFLLGAHAPLDELREVFSTDCPMVLFSSARDLTRSDVLYHPGKTTKFAHDLPFSCSDPPFTRNPPDLVQNLISSSVNAHAAAAPANRERLERLASPSIEADLHFPLFCTPYYGFVPETEVDLFVEILQLSSFLCSCCFANDGNDIPHLGDSAPTAAALLSTLSAIPNERSEGSIAAFPGTGVFICDPAPAPQNGDPAIACWLYIPTSLPPPPPAVFSTLVATLSPSDPRFATPLFETYSTAPGSRTGIPLGSHVCVHLNASLLPTPFLGQSESLQYLPVARGGIGASQYFHSFSTSGKQEPLSTITLDTHPLPFDFTDQLL